MGQIWLSEEDINNAPAKDAIRLIDHWCLSYNVSSSAIAGEIGSFLPVVHDLRTVFWELRIKDAMNRINFYESVIEPHAELLMLIEWPRQYGKRIDAIGRIADDIEKWRQKLTIAKRKYLQHAGTEYEATPEIGEITQSI